MPSTSLFGNPLPGGFGYEDEFITVDEESSLAAAIAQIEFSTFEMHGVIARRRVAFFGRTYDSGRATAPPIPDSLKPLRQKIGVWAGVDPAAFAMALINEYRAGAPIGWHRDAPQYGIVAGVSLLSECRMKFRPYVTPSDRQPRTTRRAATHSITLGRRSVYLLAGASRSGYEHHIPAVDALRYSVTFRTLRA